MCVGVALDLSKRLRQDAEGGRGPEGSTLMSQTLVNHRSATRGIGQELGKSNAEHRVSGYGDPPAATIQNIGPPLSPSPRLPAVHSDSGLPLIPDLENSGWGSMTKKFLQVKYIPFDGLSPIGTLLSG